MGCLMLCYFGLKLLNRSHFGRVAVAIRENELRAELLGYDVRLHKLQTFTIGGGIAGLAGCLGVNFNSFVNPDVFALNFAAEIIMWTLIGGLGTLVGPMIGCIGLLMLKFEIGQQQITNTYLIFGGIIMVFVLLVPAGLLPTARQLADRLVPGMRADDGPSERAREARRDRGASDAVADTAASAMPILETHGLSMRFGGVVAVDSVDFSMAEGELRCLIGPNGAGKSTFFKCLTHQYKASAGRVRFRGTDITGSHTYQIARRGIGIKTQVPSVFDGLSVHENIWVAARRLHGRREANRIVDGFWSGSASAISRGAPSASSPTASASGSSSAPCSPASPS